LVVVVYKGFSATTTIEKEKDNLQKPISTNKATPNF